MSLTDRLTDRQTDGADYIGPEAGPKNEKFHIETDICIELCSLSWETSGPSLVPFVGD